MIARTWHGEVEAAQAGEYLDYLNRSAGYVGLHSS